MLRHRALDVALALAIGLSAATAVFTDVVLFGGSIVPANALRDDPVFAPYWDERLPPRAAWDPSGVFIHYPVERHAARELRAGRVPLWNPYAAAGMPLLAEVHHAPLSPFLLPVVAAPSERSWSWFLLLRVVVAAAGAYAFVRARQGSRAAASFAGVAYALTGCAMLRFDLPTEGTAYALLPLCALAAAAAARRGGAFVGLWALAMGALVYSAHPELCALAAAGAAIAGVSEAPRSPRAWLRVAAGGALGLVIGAGVILPFLELMRGDVATYKTDPDAAGRLMSDLYYFKDWPDLLRFGAPAAALGWMAFVLPAPSAALRAFRRAAVVLGLFTLALFVLQRWAPPAIYAVVPPPRYSVFLVAFAVAILGGFGLDALVERRAGARELWQGVGFAVAWMLIAHLLTRKRFLARPDLLAGELAGIAAVLAAAWLVARGRGRSAAGVVIVCAGVALAVSGRRVVATMGERIPPSPAVEAVSALAPPPARIAGVGPNFRKTPLAPELATLYGLQDVRSFAALFPGRYRAYMSLVEGVRLEHVIVLLDSVASPLIDLMGVTHAFVAADDVPAGWSVVWRDGDLAIARNPRAAPRAFAPRRLLAAPDAAASLAELERLAAERLLPETAVVEAPAELVARLQGGDADVEITEYLSDRVTLRVRAHTPALVVLTDTYHAGWQATVDGRAATIWPTDHLFRGVAVEPGEHRIELRYRPRGWVIGARVAGAGLAAAALIVVVPLLRRRRR